MYKREDFRFYCDYRGYCIYLRKTRWEYLLKNNIFRNWASLVSVYSIAETEKIIFFNTKQEAEETLDKFLKGQNMNCVNKVYSEQSKDCELQAKRDQCIADIGVLQGNLAEIDEDIKISKDPLNKVKNYISKNLCYGNHAIIKNIKSGVYIVIRMPSSNNDWTFAAWDWTKNFCEEFTKAGVHPYPIHGYSFQDKNLWIKLGNIY